MKKYILVLYFIILFASCQSNKVTQFESQDNQTEKNVDEAFVANLRSILGDWLSYYSISLSSFKETKVSPFEIDYLKSAASIYYKKYNRNDSIYLPNIRDYSPNHRFYLDVFESMNVHMKDSVWCFSEMSDGQKIFLSDKQDSTLVLVASRNKNYLLDGAFWVNDEVFILTGLDKRDMKNCKYQIDVYDMYNKVISTYNRVDTTLRDSQKSYALYDMKRRGIIIKKE